MLAALPADPGIHRVVALGRSVQGRPIDAIEIGDADSPRKLLVVGCIHGNERAGIAVADLLARTPAPRETDLWIVPDLNPDGAAADTRQNADGVDLNRNFPWRWRPLTGVYDSGPHALSEPETRIAYRLIVRIRPSVSIWFHQHLDVVDVSGGSSNVERRFADAVGLPLVRLPRYPGSVVSWENALLPHGTAFVVELPPGPLDAPEAQRYARAVLAAARR
jgi:protein MpaA